MIVKAVWLIAEEEYTNKGRKVRIVTQSQGVVGGGQETLPFPNQNSLFKLHLQNIYIYIEGVDIYYIYILKTDIPQRNKITCTVDH